MRWPFLLSPRRLRSQKNRRPNRAINRRAGLLLTRLEDRSLPSAAIWTDKYDYRPGETALISGKGFGVGEAIDLLVVRTDVGGPDPGQAWTITDGGPRDLDGKADGNFSTTWYVDPAFATNHDLLATATGRSSGERAQVKFHDSIGLPVSIGDGVGNETAGTTIVFTTNIPVPAGLTVLVAVALDPAGGTVSVADNSTAGGAANVYTIDADVTNPSDCRSVLFPPP